MTTFLAMVAAALMLIVGVGLIALDLFTRVFYSVSVYSRMFLGKRSGYGYGYAAIAVLILVYFVMRANSSHH